MAIVDTRSWSWSSQPRVRNENPAPSPQTALSRLLNTLLPALRLIRRRRTTSGTRSLLAALAQQFQVSRTLAQHGLRPRRQAARVFLVDLGLLEQFGLARRHGPRPFLGDARRRRRVLVVRRVLRARAAGAGLFQEALRHGSFFGCSCSGFDKAEGRDWLVGEDGGGDGLRNAASHEISWPGINY